MWKLKIAEGGDEKWLTTTNNHVGRQHWEYDPDAGTQEERDEIRRIRFNFKINRFQFKQSADLLMRIQVSRSIYVFLLIFAKKYITTRKFKFNYIHMAYSIPC